MKQIFIIGSDSFWLSFCNKLQVFSSKDELKFTPIFFPKLDIRSNYNIQHKIFKEARKVFKGDLYRTNEMNSFLHSQKSTLIFTSGLKIFENIIFKQKKFKKSLMIAPSVNNKCCCNSVARILFKNKNQIDIAFFGNKSQGDDFLAYTLSYKVSKYMNSSQIYSQLGENAAINFLYLLLKNKNNLEDFTVPNAVTDYGISDKEEDIVLTKNLTKEDLLLRANRYKDSIFAPYFLGKTKGKSEFKIYFKNIKNVEPSDIRFEKHSNYIEEGALFPSFQNAKKHGYIKLSNGLLKVEEISLEGNEIKFKPLKQVFKENNLESQVLHIS